MSILRNLTKAALNLAAAPVALAVDVVTLPASSLDGDGPFDRAGACLKRAGEATGDALEGK